MRTVNVAKLKDQLSKYLTFAKSGEEVVIRDRNLPVAKLVPFSAEGADAQELRLVAAGKLRLRVTCWKSANFTLTVTVRPNACAVRHQSHTSSATA